MKRIIVILLGFTMCWGCKENNKQKAVTILEPSEFKTDSVSRSPIEIFTVVHDSTAVGDTNQLTELNNGLGKSFEEDKAIKDEEYLKQSLDSYKSMEFKKVLAKDFENNSFTKPILTNISFLAAEHDSLSVSIQVEEWNFKDESTAESCFKSLTTFSERTIFWKSINWIWVQQKNKLFLIYTEDVRVDSEPMQTVKRHLIDNLKERGEYRTVEFY